MAHWPVYALHQTLHKSARSTIIRATRLDDGGPVILKLPTEDSFDRHRSLELRREYAITRRVEGDGIIRTLGLEEFPGDRVALVLEDFGGSSLHHLLQEIGPLDVETFLEFALQITGALGHVHRQGVIHKDIKPHNLIVSPDTRQVKLADFSLSVAIAMEPATPDNPAHLMGTLAYMAPEQTGRMNRGVDYRADFYALGATFFEMLTGRLAFPAQTALELIHSHLAQLPPSPRDLAPDVPEPLASIVLKLLSKDPDARYQSTRGLTADLEACRHQLRIRGQITSFPLGGADQAHAFRLPQGLYGRASEVNLLLETYSRAIAGHPQVLLLTGSAGIGKSSLVNELHRELAASKGRFAAGKSDQFRRDVPFDAIDQVLRQLVSQTLAEGEAESAELRQRLLEVLGGNASVLAEAVPETRSLLGEQAPPMAVPADKSKNRLALTLARALQAFAVPGRPLCLFLDDLQWADGATFSVVQELAHGSGNAPLLLVGAYRDAEVSRTHSLARVLDALRATSAPLVELHLAPLGTQEVARMVREVTAADDSRALELGAFIQSRTRGNPFAVKQFLRFLHEKGLLRFDTHSGQWDWDLTRIEVAEIPDDIAGLLAEFQQLPEEVGELLGIAACLGVAFSFRELTVAHAISRNETARVLWSAIEGGWVLPLSRDYLLLDPQGAGVPADLELPLRFLHDKVRQAAYSLIPQSERAQCHVNIGLRLLEDARAQGVMEERMFSILPHLGHGPSLITSPSLKLELADLHLRAGRRAKTSGVYPTACELFRTGALLLPPDAWEREHARAFALQMELAETRYLSGEFDEAQSLFSTLLDRARTPAQRAGVHALQAMLTALSSQHGRTLELGLEGLRLLGIEIPRAPDRAMIAAEMQVVVSRLGGRKATDLLGLPGTSDPNVELSIALITNMLTSAFYSDRELFALLALRSVRLSLEHGNSRLSALSYVTYGSFLSSALDDPMTGWEFGQLATAIATHLQDSILLSRVCYVRTALIDHWTHSVRTANAEMAEAHWLALELGDWVHAGHCLLTLLWRRFAVGDPLLELLKENRRLMELLEKTRDVGSLSSCRHLHQAIQVLQGSSDEVPTSNPEGLTQTAQMTLYVCQAELNFFLGRAPQALAALEKALPLLPFHSGLFRLSTHALFHVLSASEVFPGASEARKQELLAAMEQRHAYLEKCARRAPENFAPYHLLATAELSRVKGREFEAVAQEYARAIASARTSQFLCMEALANERAFQFYKSQGHSSRALAFLLDALDAYERWGASSKVRRLSAEHADFLATWSHSLQRWSASPRRADPIPPPPDLVRESISTASSSSSEILAERLDVSSVMKASQAISSELLFPQLVSTLIQIVMESAGAQRGVLVLKRGEDTYVEAVGEVGNPEGPRIAAEPLAQSQALCLAIAQQVLNRGTHVLLDDASAEVAFREDPYIQGLRIRSVLCVPLLHRRQVVGLFYLENSLTPGAFSAGRLEVLSMLSAQAAISIENAGLYGKLEEHSRTLEQKVGERTEELHQKNTRLLATLETLKSMQLRIITQEKLASLGTLTAGIAHELRNPLNFVNNFAELSLEFLMELRGEFSGPQPPSPAQWKRLGTALEELAQNVSRVHEHGLRASNIIAGMLQHARTHRGDPQLVQINPLVEEVIRFVQHSLRARSPPLHVPIETSFDPSDPALLLVPEDMRRVIVNLVDNACYAAHKRAQRLGPPAEPHVKVSTRCVGGMVELRVRDNGDGVPEGLRDKLFTPFFTTKPPGEGTGLGLSLCHDIVVVSLGGELRLESQEGQFAEFIITLPEASPRQQAV
ncbi:trifunctional serine/threonine-protein kinase/ATP-binding protein/sensor histidine kinase [Hyalangium versicolor]|uniref:trifunctional serine/threonine-protein kinase/ATP-binding protein/sensor histidine kinase n=1 Tax=Hyalangium versicolor TaxID=2861190 RepID=UPI001CCF420D|nr:AAA family ATPase [Hyalangium versicolor]